MGSEDANGANGSRSKPLIRLREPPVDTCPDCGYEFRVTFLHPVLASVQVCPQCGTSLE